MSTTDHLQVAERLISAISAGDFKALRAIYAPDAVIWHNADGVDQSVDEYVGALRWVVGHMDEMRHEEIRRQGTDSGFVQQHVLRGRAPNGLELNVPTCLVCTIKDGRITRLDEYIDSTQIAPLHGG